MISAYLQDSLAPVSSLHYDPVERSFSAFLNRFCWESMEDHESFGHYQRVNCGLKCLEVSSFRHFGFHQHEAGLFLNLLAISYHSSSAGGTLKLTFSEHRDIQLKVEEIKIVAEDLGQPWPTFHNPNHKEFSGY